MPGLGCQGGDLVVGHGGQTIQNVPEVGQGVEAAPATALDDGIDHGTALPGAGLAYEQPVLLFMRSSA